MSKVKDFFNLNLIILLVKIVIVFIVTPISIAILIYKCSKTNMLNNNSSADELCSDGKFLLSEAKLPDELYGSAESLLLLAGSEI